MRRLMEWLRQGLCRHEWEIHRNAGYMNAGACTWVVDLRVCRRCGKVERV